MFVELINYAVKSRSPWSHFLVQYFFSHSHPHPIHTKTLQHSNMTTELTSCIIMQLTPNWDQWPGVCGWIKVLLYVALAIPSSTLPQRLPYHIVTRVSLIPRFLHAQQNTVFHSWQLTLFLHSGIYHIAGNFRGRKLSLMNFEVLIVGYWQKFSPQNLGASVSNLAAYVFCTKKSYFHKSFLPWNFPAIGYNL